MKSHILAAALAAALAAVTLLASAQTGSRSAPSPITVTVSRGQISVSSAGYRLPAGAATVTWQLATEGYRFTSDSIDFGSEQSYFSCAISNYGITIRCSKRPDAPAGRLNYRVSVTDGQGATIDQMEQPNVWVVND